MILASNSIRRQEILKDVGFIFKVLSADIDENSDKEDLIEKIKDIAYKKAYCVAEKHKNEFILAADTIVEIDGEILGKPRNEVEARNFLKKLSGNIHNVITAYSFINIDKNIVLVDYEISKVKFYVLSDEQIEWYIRSGEPFDKAGAYGIQGKGRIFVEKIDGDFFSIMGFPIAKFIKNLKKLGIEINEISKI